MARYLLRNATLIDGTGADPVADAAVAVKDGVIDWVGQARDAPAEMTLSDMTSVDLGGATICPGFFDCHVHFGVSIAVGTDAGLSPNHGTNLRELGLLAKFGGLSPMQAIVAGTKTSAEMCGVADTLGTVHEGKTADLVVVKGNPLSNIDIVGDPANIAMVVKKGRPVSNRGGYAMPSPDSAPR